MGGVVFIGGPYVRFRPTVAERDVCFLGAHQPPQPRAGALRELSILLKGPAKLLACLLSADLQQLAGEHQSLLLGQTPCEPLDATHLVAQHDELLELSSNVDDLDLPLARTSQRNRDLERGLHGAPPRQCAATISNSGLEALLENVGEVQPVDERAPLARIHNQLECGLAVAVLEILPTQLVTIRSQQQLTPGPRHERHLLGRIGAWAALAAFRPDPARTSSVLLTGGIHIPMSSPARNRPPSKSGSSSVGCCRGALSDAV